MHIQTTPKKVFDNPKTRKIRKHLRVMITMRLKIPIELVEQLRKQDQKAYKYFVHLSETLS